MYLTPSLRAPLECVTALGLKLLQCWGYLAEKKFDDVFVRSDTIHECDDTGRRLCCIPRLLRMSRGNNWTTTYCMVSESNRVSWWLYWAYCDLTDNVLCRIINIMVCGSTVFVNVDRFKLLQHGWLSGNRVGWESVAMNRETSVF